MKIEETPSRKLVVALWLCSFLTVPALSLTISRARAQERPAQSTQGQAPAKKGKPVTFQVLEGYYANKFPDQKKAGVVMLDLKRAAGMFIVYPGDGQSTEELVDEIKPMVAGMFLQGSKRKDKIELTWTASPLPKHKGVDNESGTLFVAAEGKKEVQVAIYIRNYDGTEVAYGYFAMREKGKKREDEGRFLDSSGGGVEDFDKFWQSIGQSEQ